MAFAIARRRFFDDDELAVSGTGVNTEVRHFDATEMRKNAYGTVVERTPLLLPIVDMEK